MANHYCMSAPCPVCNPTGNTTVAEPWFNNTAVSTLPPGYRWDNAHAPDRITTCRQADDAADYQIAGLLEDIADLRRRLRELGAE